MRTAKYFLTFILTLLSLSPAWAQERTLLLVPFEIRGSYQPVTKADLSAELQTQIEAHDPSIKVVVLDRWATILSSNDAARLGKSEGADLVLYGNVKFNKDAKATSMTGAAPEGYPGGTGVPMDFSRRYMVTVAGMAHGTLVDSASGEVVADQPEMVFETEMTGGAKDGKIMQEVEDRLVKQCLHDVSRRLVEHLKAETEGKR